MVGVGVALVVPAQALARAVVRFVHAVPGVGRATITVTQGDHSERIGRITFGQATGWRSIHTGRFRWTLTQARRTLAAGTATVGDGAYDLIVVQNGSHVELGVYRARGGRPGTSLIRVIHAAPELGRPELAIDGHVEIRTLQYLTATPYRTMTPGTHRLAIARPGDATPLVTSLLTARPDRSYSAIVVGTRGEQVRIITLVDRGGPLSRPGHSDVTDRDGEGRTVVVRPGDSLWSIARGLLGPDSSNAAIADRVRLLWTMNRARIGTGDPNLIFPGTVLRV